MADSHGRTFTFPGGPFNGTADEDQYFRSILPGKWYVAIEDESGTAHCSAGPFDTENEAELWAGLPEGTHVVLVADVERFPHFIVPAGRTGRVVERSASLVLVAMDEPFQGGEDWDHEIQFSDDCWDLYCLRALEAESEENG